MTTFKYNLFLDDIRSTKDVFNYTFDNRYLKLNWYTVRSFNEFVKIINEMGMPELLSIDHDLSDEHYDYIGQDTRNIDFKEKTGYECAKWLCEYCMDNKIKFPEYLVHSQNTVGRENIIYYIENYKKHVEK